MEKDDTNDKSRSSLLAPALTVSLLWSLIILASLLWNLYQHHLETNSIILNVARTHLEKDLLFRNWIVRHGGVYVPVSKETQPNPYLKPELFPERDIATPSGRTLTLVNPAYMIRQLYALPLPSQDPFYPHAKISSLRPVRPQNSPDPWEKDALLAFKRGLKQKGEFVEENGTTYMRLMKPFFAGPGCLAKCHTVDGYKEGDLMGGLSVMVPMEPFAATTRHHTVVLVTAHLVLWLLVLLGIGFAFAGLHKRNLARQRSEEALRRNEEHFRSLIENALDIITVLDENGVTTFESPSMPRKLGHALPVMLHQPLVEKVHPDDRVRIGKVLQRLAANPGTTETFEMRCQHRDGSWRILEAVGQWLPDLSPPSYVINSRDITSRKEAEKKLLSYQGQLRSLASRLSQAEEETRRAIADELHEQVGQNLSVIKLKLGQLRRSLSSAEALAQFDSFGQLLEAIINDTRSMTFQLSPPILYDIGLEAAVSWIAEQFQANNDIPCRVEDDNLEKPITADLRSVLFRSVQEALCNIIKYADARQVTITISREENFIRINIVDNGRGFDPSELEKYGDRSAGFGLFSIRERLDLLGGHLTVFSAPGVGTKLAMLAPLNLDDDETGGEL